jgi:hypothetical protein
MKKHLILTSLAVAVLMAGGAGAAQYTVKKGDWLSKIAANHDVTTQQLMDWNPEIANRNVIYPGEMLYIGEPNQRPIFEHEPASRHEPVHHKKKCDKCENVINGNPMYRPKEGRFFSVTTFGTDTNFENWGLNEYFGFGFTDNFGIFLKTDLVTHEFDKDETKWDNLEAGLSLRYMNAGNWKADAYGSLRANRTTSDWWDDGNFYTWNVGTKIGYSSCEWTLNGLFEYEYANEGAFDWKQDALGRGYRAGLEGQYVFNNDWNIVAGATYEMPEVLENFWTGKVGLNYNFSPYSYLGLYVTQELHDGDLNDDTGLAIQFGVDF